MSVDDYLAHLSLLPLTFDLFVNDYNLAVVQGGEATAEIAAIQDYIEKERQYIAETAVPACADAHFARFESWVEAWGFIADRLPARTPAATLATFERVSAANEQWSALVDDAEDLCES